MSARGGSLPLLRRELLALLRGRREFWLLVLAVSVSSIVPLLSWGTVASAARRGTRSAEGVVMFLFAQLAVVLVAVAATMATSITLERDRGTWDALVMTRLAPLEIVLSKLGSSLAFTGLLLIASAPAACTLYLLGGTSLGTILSAYAVSFQAAVLAACCSLDVSAHTARTSHAVIASLMLCTVWSIAPVYLFICVCAALSSAVLYQLFVRLLGRRVVHFAWYLVAGFLIAWPSVTLLRPFSFSPFGIIWSEASVGSRAGVQLGYTGVILLSCAAHCLHAARQVLRPAPPPPPRTQQSNAPTVMAWLGALERRLAGSSRFRRLMDGKSALGPMLRNPVFVREMAAKPHGTLHSQFRSFLFSLLILLVIAMGSLMGPWGVSRTVCMAAAALCLLVPAGFGAIWLDRERAHGILDALRSTALASREIITGRLLASLECTPGIVAATMTMLGMCMAFHLLVQAIRSPGDAVIIQGSIIAASFLPLIVLSASYGAAAGVLASVVAVRTLPALLLALALCLLPLAALLGLPRSVASRPWLPLVAAGALAMAAFVFWLAAIWWFERFRMRDR